MGPAADEAVLRSQGSGLPSRSVPSPTSARVNLTWKPRPAPQTIAVNKKTKIHETTARFLRLNGSRSVRRPMMTEPVMDPRPVRSETRARVRPLNSTEVIDPWYA